MDIVLVLTTGEGGIPHYTAELANSLCELENNVFVIKPQDTTADEFFCDGVNKKDWLQNSRVSFSSISEMDVSISQVIESCRSLSNLSRISELEPDVIHFSHKPHSYLRPFIPELETQTPIVETRHETENTNLFKIPGRDVPLRQDLMIVAAMNMDSIFRNTFSGIPADGYIAHTRQNVDDLVAKYPGASVDLIPHGSFTIFDPDPNSDTIEDNVSEDNRVLFFGRIDAMKNPNQLVKATVKAADEVENLTTLIAGPGDLSKETIDIIKRNPELFEVRNEFVPNSEVPDLFARSDIVAVPHEQQQGHSGTMTIAFSHGKPIVATDVGEFDRLVTRSGAGYTVEVGNVSAMENAMCSLLQNPELRGAMEENSKEMSEVLSWNAVAAKTINFYEKLL